MLINDNIDIDIGFKMWLKFYIGIDKELQLKKTTKSELFSLRNKDGDED